MEEVAGKVGGPVEKDENMKHGLQSVMDYYRPICVHLN